MNGQVFIAQLNPVVKLIAVMTFGLASMLWPNFWLGLFLSCVLLLCAYSAHMTLSYVKVITAFGIPLTGMLMFIQGLYSPRNRTFIAEIAGLKIGLEGIEYAGKVSLTILVFLGSFYIMKKTSSMNSLVTALTQYGVNPRVGYLILASMNVVPQMKKRFISIQEAQSARGLRVDGGVITRVSAIVPLFGPVVLSSLTDAQERGMTLETRGFSQKGKHTSLTEIPWRKSDSIVVVLLGVFFVAISVFSITVWCGVFSV